MIPIQRIFLLIIIVPSFFSCDSSKVYEKYIEIDNALWKNEEVVKFEFNATDTTSYHNLYINIRNTENYAFSNLYLFVKIEGPNNHSSTDTVNCNLADSRGRWTGDGVGNLWNYKKPFLGQVKFAQKGKYIISYEHAMRVKENLSGIADVGLRIEKIKL